jgi:ferrochelatase
MDGRVLDAPYLVRWVVVHGLILPFRPQQSAEAYAKIWGEDGSPLLVISQRLQSDLQRRVEVPVELAMRYGRPSIEETLHRLNFHGVQDLLVIPLFPHYAMSSYESAVARVKNVAARRASHFRLTFLPPFYDHPEYIDALVASAEPHFDGDDYLLFSFHGVPERHLRKTDPTQNHCLSSADCCDRDSPALAPCYRAQCLRTANAFVSRANIKNYSVSFQSRLGRDRWLQPYTDQELERLARSGIRRLRVICPAFVADCLETLEEIGIRGRATFLEAGGAELTQIPCLNAHPAWVQMLERRVQEFAG